MYFEKKKVNTAHLRLYTCKAENEFMFMSLMVRVDRVKNSNTLNSGSPFQMNRLEASGIRFALREAGCRGNGLSSSGRVSEASVRTAVTLCTHFAVSRSQ